MSLSRTSYLCILEQLICLGQHCSCVTSSQFAKSNTERKKEKERDKVTETSMQSILLVSCRSFFPIYRMSTESFVPSLLLGKPGLVYLRAPWNFSAKLQLLKYLPPGELAALTELCSKCLQEVVISVTSLINIHSLIIYLRFIYETLRFIMKTIPSKMQQQHCNADLQD